ncbi:hypothetical protein RR48_00332, partial [Papilio machaon]
RAEHWRRYGGALTLCVLRRDDRVHMDFLLRLEYLYQVKYYTLFTFWDSLPSNQDLSEVTRPRSNSLGSEETNPMTPLSIKDKRQVGLFN